MRINGMIYRAFRHPTAPVRVHFGPGKKRYLEGWINLDANFITAKIDLWANLLDPLPFRDSSVELFYSFHVIEHLPDAYLPQHFKDMYRCLKPGGGVRVGGPDVGNACRKYLEGDLDWFSDFPDRRESIGGRFTNFVFCQGEHLTALSHSYLRELAQEAGFTDIRFCIPSRESDLIGPEVMAMEEESDLSCPHSIVMEARKPLHPTRTPSGSDERRPDPRPGGAHGPNPHTLSRPGAPRLAGTQGAGPRRMPYLGALWPES